MTKCQEYVNKKSISFLGDAFLLHNIQSILFNEEIYDSKIYKIVEIY